MLARGEALTPCQTPLHSENLDTRIHVLPYARFPICAFVPRAAHTYHLIFLSDPETNACGPSSQSES